LACIFSSILYCFIKKKRPQMGAFFVYNLDIFSLFLHKEAIKHLAHFGFLAVQTYLP